MEEEEEALPVHPGDLLPLSTGKLEKKGTGRIVEKFAMRRVIHRRQLFVLRSCV